MDEYQAAWDRYILVVKEGAAALKPYRRLSRKDPMVRRIANGVSARIMMARDRVIKGSEALHEARFGACVSAGTSGTSS